MAKKKSFDCPLHALQVISRVMKKEIEEVMSIVMEKEIEEMKRRKKWECVSSNFFNLHSRVVEIADRSKRDFCVVQIESHARTRTTLRKVAHSRNPDRDLNTNKLPNITTTHLSTNLKVYVHTKSKGAGMRNVCKTAGATSTTC